MNFEVIGGFWEMGIFFSFDFFHLLSIFSVIPSSTSLPTLFLLLCNIKKLKSVLDEQKHGHVKSNGGIQPLFTSISSKMATKRERRVAHAI